MTAELTPNLFAVEVALRGWFPSWLAVALGVAALGAVVLVYARESGRLPLWRRAGLAGLRALTLVSILTLLMKPTLLWEVREERRRPVAVLADDSQSMTVQDARTTYADRWRVALAFDRVPPTQALPELASAGDLPAELPESPSRLDILKAALTNPRLDLLARLAAVGPLQPSTFGSSRGARDPGNAGWVAAMAGKEPRTALADSVLDLLKRDANELPAAVVLLTDGRENASRAGLAELGAECARLRVPLHVYGVGGSTVGRLTLRDAVVPETLFVDDTVSIPVRLRASGHKEGRAELVVRLNGREVARKEFDLAEGDDLRETLSFVPALADAAPGKQELSTSVRRVSDGEKPSDEVTRSVRVVDRKVKVLAVDSVPRWDFKYLQRALLRDRRVEARFWLSQGDKVAMAAGPPFLPAFPASREELFAYDLLILGDLPAAALTGAQQEAVRDFVSEGGGLILIAGRSAAPASYVGTPLADVLPVEVSPREFPADGGRAASFRPEMTPTGVRSAVLRLTDDPAENARLWRALPEIYWHYPVNRLKPAAEALVAHPTARTPDGKPMPLMAAHYYGKGYAVFCGFDETWRWRYNEADKFFGRFWSQTVYVAGVPRTLGTKFTQLSLDTPDPLLGQTGQVYARLFKGDLTPQSAEQVEGVLERLDGGADARDRTSRVTLRRLPGVGGDYTAALPFNRTGKYTLTVDNGGNPGTAEYRVTLPVEHELSAGGMLEDELRALAEQSGGKFYREEDLNRLPDSIAPRIVPTTVRQETVLWNVWSLLWVVGLLSLEWSLRKFSSLS